MSNTNTGGPAFPQYAWNTTAEKFTAAGGMTLRDYFAAKAVQAEIINNIHESDFAWSAARAYKMADAMLKAREQ